MNASADVGASTTPRRPLVVLKALRPHQWAKNLLVFSAPLAGHRFSVETWRLAGIAFLCFCAAASSGYLVNDLLDRHADRTHRTKKTRVVAAGELRAQSAVLLATILGLCAVGSSFAVSPDLAAVLLAYLGMSVAYSLFLKSYVVIDVIAVAAMLTTRVVGGSIVTAIPMSNWLIMFCLFLFLSISLAKRCSEIASSADMGRAKIARRGYRTADLPLLAAMGAAAGYSSALVLSAYIASPEVKLLYSHGERLWFAVPFLIYWIGRVMLLANRGELDEDPIIFAVADRATWVVGACVALTVTLAF